VSHSQARQPAEDPQALGRQLVHELDRLARAAEGSKALREPFLYQVYLEKILIEAWVMVADGDLQGPRAFLRQLAAAEDIIKPFLRGLDLEHPHVEAAREVYGVIQALEAAERSLKIRRSKISQVKRRRSETECEVLRVLSESDERYLRRGEIYESMSPQPTRGRVSQILADLYGEGVVKRVQAPAQGSRETSFFALTERGRDLVREFGIGKQPAHFERSGHRWRSFLEPEAVALQDEPSRIGSISAFYSHCRGVGRSLALVHSALRLAKEADNCSILVIDFTRSASGLSEYFGSSTVPCCRGLWGLWEDYLQQPERERRSWLSAALQDSLYVLQPSSKRENLYFLPSGELPIAGDIDSRLLREIALQPRGADGAPLTATRGFLGDLRKALGENFSKVLIDTATELDPAAYAGTVLLSDKLVLFLRVDDRNLSVPRTVLGNFLWSKSSLGACVPATFVFSMLPMIPLDLHRRVDALLDHDQRREREHVYQIVPLYYEPDVALGSLLVREDGLWKRYSDEDLLTAGYQDLTVALQRPISSGNWKIRAEEMRERLATRVKGVRRYSPGAGLRSLLSPSEGKSSDIRVRGSLPQSPQEEEELKAALDAVAAGAR